MEFSLACTLQPARVRGGPETMALTMQKRCSSFVTTILRRGNRQKEGKNKKRERSKELRRCFSSYYVLLFYLLEYFLKYILKYLSKSI